MAHGDESRRAVRAAYVFDQLSLEIAAVKHGVPYATCRNWKRAGKEMGDDWDKARAAQALRRQDRVQPEQPVAVGLLEFLVDWNRIDFGAPDQVVTRVVADTLGSYGSGSVVVLLEESQRDASRARYSPLSSEWTTSHLKPAARP